ncbi:MAG: tripartite tricarboxylate transporter substrate binding protein [Betaproteobacteria bacterium]|nr:tripartite tricarboxylate transporter substrate binding protein [Betaproteobacteria bacterium]
MLSRVGGLLICVVALLLPIAGEAQEFPSRPIRIVVGFTPGGTADTVVRRLSVGLAKRLGQSIVIDNKPGGNTIIATVFVHGTAPDGHTLYATFSTPYAMNPFLYKKLPYDPAAYTPVAILGRVPQGLVVRRDSALNSLQDYVRHAQANPGKLTYGSPGIGSPNSILMESFKRSTQVDVLPVPFQGANPALNALLAGHIDSIWASLPSALGHLKDGRIKLLAVVGTKRLSLMPDAPTFDELGYGAGLGVDSWLGIVAPQNTPRDVVARLNREINSEVQLPEMRAWLLSQAVEPETNTPEALAAEMKSEVPQWERMIRAIGLSLD